MHSTEKEIARGKRSAVFILVAMLLALAYFLARLDWQGDETVVIPEVKQAVIAAYRIGVQLPVNTPIAYKETGISLQRLSENGVKWIIYRIPLWTPTSRRAEFGREELSEHKERISLLQSHGFRIIVAPVYWNTTILTSQPEREMSKEFFLMYHSFTTEMAEFCEDIEAEVFLLDSIFGHEGIAVSEWLELIGKLRGTFGGKLEIRIHPGMTPAIYKKYVDGMWLEVGENTDNADLSEWHNAVSVPLYLLMPDPDEYVADLLPWKPTLKKTGSRALLRNLLALADHSEELRGIVLSGNATYSLLLNEADTGEIRRSLQTLRERELRHDLLKSQNTSLH